MSSPPISVKGVLIDRDRVLLLLNERGEWDLPGGRPDPGEDHRAALEREVQEEAGLASRSARRWATICSRSCPGASFAFCPSSAA